uniref:NADH-plastoquinone oxidoreductase subunit K n=1 Tax=Dionaea muscipula TaxID=4362 RepID=A0A411K341_DIOMU|nr:NADH-plastoquinone oxidoreductase subunit K [Dionaea muscipula]
MYLLFRVHHKGNENQDLLYPVSNENYEQIEHLSKGSVPSHEL